jgi:hypothetical protein
VAHQERFDALAIGLATNQLSRGQVLRGLVAGALIGTFPLFWARSVGARTRKEGGERCRNPDQCRSGSCVGEFDDTGRFRGRCTAVCPTDKCISAGTAGPRDCTPYCGDCEVCSADQRCLPNCGDRRCLECRDGNCVDICVTCRATTALATIGVVNARRSRCGPCETCDSGTGRCVPKTCVPPEVLNPETCQCEGQGEGAICCFAFDSVTGERLVFQNGQITGGMCGGSPMVCTPGGICCGVAVITDPVTGLPTGCSSTGFGDVGACPAPANANLSPAGADSGAGVPARPRSGVAPRAIARRRQDGLGGGPPGRGSGPFLGPSGPPGLNAKPELPRWGRQAGDAALPHPELPSLRRRLRRYLPSRARWRRG